jgi:NAD(P)H-nitrite reductase large subunit
MRHVILGAGPAGVSAAEIIRVTEPDAEIKLIGAEPEPPYSRMALPYLLSGRIDAAGTHLRKTPGHYAANRIEVIHDRATRVDPANHTLTLAANGNIRFDKLLIATGASPIIPALPGSDSEGVYPCWTLADARNIIARAKAGAEAVLIGAGFIGCILLEALVTRGVRLQVVEMADRMIPRMLDRTAAGLLRHWCESHGVAIHTSAKLSAIDQSAGRLAVRLENGRALKADLIIIAAGVRANTQFLQGSGIDVDTGVLVNAHLRTSAEDIYAAGDVCQGRDFSTGQYDVQAIQPTAVEHGRLAALNMCGRNIAHQGSINMNVLDTLGLVSASFGQWDGGSDSAEFSDPSGYRYLNLQFQEDVLTGAQAVGLIEHVGILRGLIQSRLRLGKWQARLLHDPTRLMEAYIGASRNISFFSRV